MSKRPRVLIAKQVPAAVEELISSFCDYQKWTGEGTMPRPELLKSLGEVEGLLINGEKIDRELLDHAPHLKVVSNISVGYNNFDLQEMKARNVLGTNTPYVLDETVADLIFGLIVASARRISELDRFVKKGNWQKNINEQHFGVDVHHQTLGIIGLGRIGEAIAQRAVQGFNMNLLYHNRSRKEEIEQKYGAQFCSLEHLLQESDFVVLMTPLSPQTVRLMGTKEFNSMKRTAIFINASRGETVDEQALVEALTEGKIYGAGLDVYSNEPVDPNHPLLKFPNVVTVPHIGSATTQTRFAMAMRAAENLIEALKGGYPPDLVPELQKNG